MVSASKLPSHLVLHRHEHGTSLSCRWSAGVFTPAEVTESFCAIAASTERRALALTPDFSWYPPSGDARSELAITKASGLEPTVYTRAKERIHITEGGDPHGKLTSVES